MVESVDTRDLKSLGQEWLCGFKSRFEYKNPLQELFHARDFCVNMCALFLLRKALGRSVNGADNRCAAICRTRYGIRLEGRSFFQRLAVPFL